MKTPALIVQFLRSLPAALVYEAAGQVGAMAPRIRLMAPAPRMAGRAFTVRGPAGDNRGIVRAISAASRDDVLVIDAGGTQDSASWGGTSTAACIAKGIAGAVIESAVRDLDEIAAARFPVYGLGPAIRGAVREHDGWLKEPVTVGGLRVQMGDYVVGDTDGVVVVEAARIEEVLDRAIEKQVRDTERDRRLSAGEDIAAMFGFR